MQNYTGFDPNAKFVAMRPFRCMDRDYQPGDPFDASQLEERLIRAHFEQRFIRVGGNLDHIPVTAAAQLMPEKRIAPPKVSNGLEVRHVGRGRYGVFLAGKRLDKIEPCTKQEALAHLEELERAAA